MTFHEGNIDNESQYFIQLTEIVHTYVSVYLFLSSTQSPDRGDVEYADSISAEG